MIKSILEYLRENLLSVVSIVCAIAIFVLTKGCLASLSAGIIIKASDSFVDENDAKSSNDKALFNATFAVVMSAVSIIAWAHFGWYVFAIFEIMNLCDLVKDLAYVCKVYNACNC